MTNKYFFLLNVVLPCSIINIDIIKYIQLNIILFIFGTQNNNSKKLIDLLLYKVVAKCKSIIVSCVKIVYDYF